MTESEKIMLFNNIASTDDKYKQYEQLTKVAHNCDLCPRMLNSVKVLTNANGNIHSKVVFIAEAPGRLGADRTLVPLHGDKAGDNFELLLSNAGWKRKDVFITNAVLCNPKDEMGRNSRPQSTEINNCLLLLQITIDLINPELVVALGGVALDALSRISPHEYSLKEHVGKAVHWYNRSLFVCYHPGQRALLHRSMSNQRKDYYRLSKVADPVKGLLKQKKAKTSNNRKTSTDIFLLSEMIRVVLLREKEISRFKLAKLLYLIDLNAKMHLGSMISGSVYIRAMDGPWPPKLTDALRVFDHNELIIKSRTERYAIKIGPNFRAKSSLEFEAIELIYDILDKYAGKSNSEIKTISYLTKPMKTILRRESKGERLLNSVIRFQ